METLIPFPLNGTDLSYGLVTGDKLNPPSQLLAGKLTYASRIQSQKHSVRSTNSKYNFTACSKNKIQFHNHMIM